MLRSAPGRRPCSAMMRSTRSWSSMRDGVDARLLIIEISRRRPRAATRDGRRARGPAVLTLATLASRPRPRHGAFVPGGHTAHGGGSFDSEPAGGAAAAGTTAPGREAALLDRSSRRARAGQADGHFERAPALGVREERLGGESMTCKAGARIEEATDREGEADGRASA